MNTMLESHHPNRPSIDPGETLEQQPHGYVRYIRHMGSDTAIVEAARVSYGSPSKGHEADMKLLSYLFRMRHTSPFEQCSITFNIRMPVFCMRQFVRHRTFRLNEYSARYKELPDEFFYPYKWRVADSTNKQGSVEVHGEDLNKYWNEENHAIANKAYETAYQCYMDLLKRGVASELARIVIPVGVYTEIYVNCDLHNLMHFLRLRLDSHAQKEIQDIARAMKWIAERIFPYTFQNFDRYQMVMEDRQASAGPVA
jgi:thymidylate synthase (FAD)